MRSDKKTSFEDRMVKYILTPKKEKHLPTWRVALEMKYNGATKEQLAIYMFGDSSMSYLLK